MEGSKLEGDFSPENSTGNDSQSGPQDQQNEGNSPEEIPLITTVTEILDNDGVSAISGASTITPAPNPGSKAAGKRPVEPIAASTRPVRARKEATRQKFFEEFGKSRGYLAHSPRIEPLTYEKAINEPDIRKWIQAMGDELTAHMINRI